MNERTSWVYLMTNRSGTLYVGMTNDLMRRVAEHRQGQIPGFTARYKITQLIHAESCSSVVEAIAREKEIKGWRREKKLTLIAESNPDWLDLAGEWSSNPGIQA
jgi:putative endonuclease